jgi:acyl-CoA thioesterase I
MRRIVPLILATAALAAGADGRVLLNFDSADQVVAPAEKGRVEAVDGHDGKAVKFTFDAESNGKYARAKFRGEADWDQAAGISFWVKGDGSPHLGALEFIWNEDYAQRYAISFRIDSTEWTKVVVPWRDFLAESSAPAAVPLDPATDHKPSQLSLAWFGKWWFWRPQVAHSYAIDDLRLEPSIPTDTADLRPKGEPLARVRAKAAAGKPITVVAMGDSLTDTKHWTNQKTNWPLFLGEVLKRDAKCDLTLVNHALGGTELRGNILRIPVWVESTPKPDLVTIMFGANDEAANATGDSFRLTMVDAIRRVRRATGGEADVLVMATAPKADDAHAHQALAEACRAAAKAENAGLCDVAAAFAALPDDQRNAAFADDKVHLAPPGQQLVAKTVEASILGK